jgi:hypothetical protein
MTKPYGIKSKETIYGKMGGWPPWLYLNCIGRHDGLFLDYQWVTSYYYIYE